MRTLLVPIITLMMMMMPLLVPAAFSRPWSLDDDGGVGKMFHILDREECVVQPFDHHHHQAAVGGPRWQALLSYSTVRAELLKDVRCYIALIGNVDHHRIQGLLKGELNSPSSRYNAMKPDMSK